MQIRTIQLVSLALIAGACGSNSYDIVVRNGTIVDGSGSPGFVGDIAIDGDSIVAVGDIGNASGDVEIDASGSVVAPGFINMLSWATEDLLEDGDAMSDILQGVTLEVFGEGWSMGPLSETMKQDELESQGDIKFDISWTTLGEYLDHLTDRGVSVNVASFVGATTVRIHELGSVDRAPTAEELERMQGLVRQAMREGAMGVGSSLIYAPAFYADTEELIALASAAGEFGGMYISHLRSEGDRLLEAVDELIRIATEAGVPAEIYHLKQSGSDNWHKLDSVIERVEAARANGVRITADMYTYVAGATGLDASMPPWVQEGGYDDWVDRLQQPSIRRRVLQEMESPGGEWENLYAAAGSADRLLLVSFRADSLRHLTGRTLAEVAEMRGTSPAETAIDPSDSKRRGCRDGLFSDVRRKRNTANRYSMAQFLGRMRAPKNCVHHSRTRLHIREPTATSPGCSASMCVMRELRHWRVRFDA